MKQLRIVYDLGVDENGRPILRRQTLNVLDSATNEQLNTFLTNLANVLSVQIDSAFAIDINQIF